MNRAEAVVIIPTYNERENAELIIRAVLALSAGFHVLVVDDNSPDGTAGVVNELLNEFSGRLFLEERPGKQGLGTAYIHGFRWALARGYAFIFEMDADFSHNPADLERLLAACQQDATGTDNTDRPAADLAIGSRYSNGVNVVNWPMSRVLMSYFASAYVRLITGLPVQDTTAGFKCYRAEVLRTIPLDRIRFVGYAFQIEMKFLAWCYGFRIREVPIIFTDRTRGQSKMSTGIFREAVFGVMQMKIDSLFRSFTR